MTERINIEERRPTEQIHLDCNPIARERIMPHANPAENNPSDVLKRLLVEEQLTYAQIGRLFITNRGRIGVWVKRGNIPPPTYRERALKRWKGWKAQGRDPLHTPVINATRGASVREYYKNNRAQNPPA